MQTRLGRPQHNASEGNVAESPLARCAQTRRASRVLRPSPPWRGGPEPQHPSLLPSRPPHVETHACSGSQDSACALAPAAERPCRLPPSQARAPGAGASPPSVRGGAGERRGAEAAWGRGRSRWKPEGCDPSGWNPRGLRSRVRLGAGGKPLALLSRDRGQGLGCCLVHKFLPGARPGNRFTEWGALGWFLPPGSRSSSGPVPSGSQKANVLHFLQGTCLRRRMY